MIKQETKKNNDYINGIKLLKLMIETFPECKVTQTMKFIIDNPNQNFTDIWKLYSNIDKNWKEIGMTKHNYYKAKKELVEIFLEIL